MGTPAVTAEKGCSRMARESQRAVRRQYDGRTLKRTRSLRLRKILEHAFRHTEYYRERFARSEFTLDSLLDENNFERLPFLTKHDLNISLARLIANTHSPLDLFKCRRGFSSGTTGVPVLAFFDRFTEALASTQFIQFLHNNHLEIAPGSTGILNLVEFEGLSSYYHVMRDLSNSLYYRINLSAERWKEPEQLLNFLSQLQPAIIQGRPTPLGLLANAIDAWPEGKRFKPKAIMSYGETLQEDARERLSTSLGADIYDAYGITELGGIVGIECHMHIGFHLFSDSFLVEIVDEDGGRLTPGQVGEIAITSLVNRVMPIIRYRTGDMGMIRPDECTCGIKHPLLNLSGGRVVSFFVGADGKRFNPYPLGQLMDELPVLQYQIVQEDVKRVCILYVPKREIDDEKWEAVSQGIRRRMGDDCVVVMKKVASFKTGEKTLQKFLCRARPE